jgi:OmpA-OmpF porin, OOP family
MKRLIFCLLLLTDSVLAQKIPVQPIITDKPRYEEANDPEVSIRRVELTPKATVIYMTFAKRRAVMADEVPVSEIQFQPNARLYVNQGEFSYKFLRAANIPVQGKRQVTNGQRVDFVVYFERLRPGQTAFDLYECSDRDGYVCFNFWNVKVNNPGRTPPVPVVTPKPAVVPKPAVPVKPAAPTKPPVAVKPAAPSKPPVVSKPAAPVKPPVVSKPAAPVKPVPKPPVGGGKVPPVAVPAPVAVAIRGTVQDATNRKPLTANVIALPLGGPNRVASSDATDRETGAFRLEARPQTVFALTISARGYFSLHDTLRVGTTDLVRAVSLSPIVVGAKLTLRNLYFDASAFVIRPESQPELDRLARIMADNPTLSIRLEGHTDIVGEYDKNLELSRNRVGAVRDVLVKRGIAASRIAVVGYGASRPINKNRTLAERPENRRVELVVTSI